METRHLIEATCPECRGPLTEIQDDGIVVYSCLVGHKYSPATLLAAHYETQERILWAAVVALEEAEKMVQAVARYLERDTAERLRDDAQSKRRQADDVRRVLNELKPYHLARD